MVQEETSQKIDVDFNQIHSSDRESSIWGYIKFLFSRKYQLRQLTIETFHEKKKI